MIRGYNRILLDGIGGSGQLDIDQKMVGEGKVNGKIDSHRKGSRGTLLTMTVISHEPLTIFSSSN